MMLHFLHHRSRPRFKAFSRMNYWIAWRSGRRARQRAFSFVERSRRINRMFKTGIVVVTALLIALLLWSNAPGRNLASWLATRTRWGLMQVVGLSPDRREIDADWKRRRLYDIGQTRKKLRSTYAEYDPPMQRLLDYAGLDPDHAVLRWGNFDKTLYLPSTVFEPDDSGRSYRFRPNTRSIWVRNLRLKGGILAYFPIPVSDRLDEVVKGTGALVVTTSVQTTNSWGLRGPEPDLEAPLRGIVLGDSYIQGLFVSDDQTPTECLKRFLTDKRSVRTEILNTGHMGYSPEQEYFTLREYADSFRPQFVILSLFANDFGDLFEVLEGKGDWQEGKYWLEQIDQFCRARSWPCLVVPAPWINQLAGPRNLGFYQGKVSNILQNTAMDFLDPMEDFRNESLRLAAEAQRQGKPTSPNPLFNGHLADGHFSPLGCELWARVVGARLSLLLDNQSQERRARP
jgi:hypothetical protein